MEPTKWKSGVAGLPVVAAKVTFMSKSSQLVVDGVAVDLTRRRVKAARLAVRPDGTVRLSAPHGVPQERLESFVRSQRSWILEQQAKQRALQAPVENLGHGGAVLLWGVWREVLRSVGPRARAELDGPRVHIVAPDEPSAQRAMERLRRDEIEAATARLAPALEERIGQRAAGYRFRAMVSRWGSCNVQTRQISINTWLVQRDPSGLEYVLAHEIAHLVERGHGPRFRAVMDDALPQWRQVRRVLSEFMPPRG